MSASSVCSLPFFEFQGPGSPEFDAESILGSEVEEGIDSIMGMGNLSMSSNCVKDDTLDCLMSFCGLGFGFGISPNISRALRQKDKGEWWWAHVVDVRDIVPKLKMKPAKTKTKKKKEVAEKDIAGGSSPEDVILWPRLWLKLDYSEVRKAWSGGSPFFGEAIVRAKFLLYFKKSSSSFFYCLIQPFFLFKSTFFILHTILFESNFSQYISSLPERI